MLRNAGVKSITLKAMPSPMSLVHTIPETLKMLKGPLSMNGKASSALLKKPTSGSSIIIQPMVVDRLGNM